MCGVLLLRTACHAVRIHILLVGTEMRHSDEEGLLPERTNSMPRPKRALPNWQAELHRKPPPELARHDRGKGAR
jgi:hypothetical protein